MGERRDSGCPHCEVADRPAASAAERRTLRCGRPFRRARRAGRRKRRAGSRRDRSRDGGRLEAGHPDAIAEKQMIERAVDAPEERAEVAPAPLIGEAGAGPVEALVGQAVVAGVVLPRRRHPSCLAGGGRNPTRQIADQSGDDGAGSRWRAGRRPEPGGSRGTGSRTWEIPSRLK